MKVIAFSALCIDYYPEQGVSKPGGNSLNFAINAKKIHPEEVAVAGFVGDDIGGRQIIELLKKNEITTKLLYIKKGETASNKLYNTPDGERYSNPGEWQDGVFNAYDFSGNDYLSILTYDVIAIPYTDKKLGTLIQKNTGDSKIVVDFLHFDDDQILSKFLPDIEIAFVSTQKKNLEKLEQISNENKKMVVALLGAEGSAVFYRNRKYFQPAIEVDEVVDTTGCGDAYQAAFCITYFTGQNIREAMFEGAVRASEVLKKFGGAG
ncbi:MAG: hypothetical protein JXB24_02690 [Bacteroidales bacterium]|nr:hypothetical protein [Bacteroidales bacterium]